MSGDLPPNFGGGSTFPSPDSPHWAPTSVAQPLPRRPRSWPAVVLAVAATLIAIAALIVSLTRSNPTPAPNAAPTFTSAEVAAAERQLCDTYTLVARAVQADTNGNDRALARISLTNGAAMIDDAAANPALDAAHRDAARVLANAYRTTVAMASGGTEAQWQAANDAGNAKDAEMKRVCGGG